MENVLGLLTIKQASTWASEYLNKNITTSNISYLIQYGRVKKISNNGITLINKQDLIKYYDSYSSKREIKWKDKLGKDLNWNLSFDNLKESDTTKHVHRLHPYKGKFIPQLVKYFLDGHTNDFKKKVYFKKGDIVLDPFCGSGTTLVESNELGIHAIGIDISTFNALISNVKIDKYDFATLQTEIQKITKALKRFIAGSKTVSFEKTLIRQLISFNNEYFPVPEYKYKVRRGKINEYKYGAKKEKKILKIYEKILNKHNIKLKQDKSDNFLDKWYLKHARKEMDFVHNIIKQIKNLSTKNVLNIILSRTIRSCRATKHADLATLIEPVTAPYYCAKHGKICKPLFSILSWWERYCKDTLKRLAIFNKLRTDTYQICLTGDSRTINITNTLKKKNSSFAKLVKKQKIKGIFSSPPYVGLIDYHKQHAYAYDLFGFESKDELEIGPLSKGRSEEAQKLYIKGISDVLNNCKKFLAEDYDIFLVANDKHNLYEDIAKKSNLKIINKYKRPVLNRTSRDRQPYSEIIFHMKKIN